MSRIPDTHAEAWALLPWLANGRLGPEEREWVEAHVGACAECRAELGAQRKVADTLARTVDGAPVGEEQKAFNKLWARVEALESSPSAPVESASEPRVRSSRTVRWLVAAVVVQAIGLGVLGLSALRGPANPDFINVSLPVNALEAPAVRVVFTPEASIETVNTLLMHQGLQLVEGPGLQGNFTAILSTEAVASGASAESVAAVMKKDPNVSFAEPVAR
jgi:anti-sigma factor RsiW